LIFFGNAFTKDISKGMGKFLWEDIVRFKQNFEFRDLGFFPNHDMFDPHGFHRLLGGF